MLLSSVPSASEQDCLRKEVDDLMQVHTQYTAHLLRTRHQGEYYKYILDNLQAGEAVVVVDYKMKLELGVRKREIQRDWYGKRGISLHGFLAIAQVSETERRTEVIDLWSEDRVPWTCAFAGWRRSSLAFEYIYFLVSIHISNTIYICIGNSMICSDIWHKYH